jgi:oligopeptide/dipeptide ABC transporter ATP-binding protein
MLELHGVSKSFRTGTFGGAELAAVRDVSFAIAPGEIVSLIGESGSGKSTIGRMLLRLVAPTTGSISYDGKGISELKEREYHRHVQGVFQDPFSSYNPIFKADRVFATIRSSYFPRTRSAAWGEKVEKSIDSVGLNPADVLGKYPHQLSGGQLQRLLIARALLLELRFLVADEVISMLDASTRVDVLNLLADLQQRGLGILFITHDLSLGNYISQRTVILRRGSIVELGPTQKVFGDPRHPYTKALVASVPQLHRKWGETERVAREDVAGDGAELVEVSAGHLVAQAPEAPPR